MKITTILSTVALGIVLITTPLLAQTMPAGTVHPGTQPQGAIAPDSVPAKLSRSQRKVLRQNRRAVNQNARLQTEGTTNTSMQDAQYRQSSVSDGTAINNSNVTNYNSNNTTNAPTGVGSNPNVPGGRNTTPAADTPSSGAEMTSSTGTATVIKEARTSETPAVKAGSTIRNTSIGDFMASSPNYTTLLNALQQTNLLETLKGTGPYTLFAPDNNAFKQLPSTIQNGLLDGSHADALKQLLAYHVIMGTVSTEEAKTPREYTTLAGSKIQVRATANGQLDITDEQGHTSRADGRGQQQANGVVYGLKTVLMPKSESSRFR